MTIAEYQELVENSCKTWNSDFQQKVKACSNMQFPREINLFKNHKVNSKLELYGCILDDVHSYLNDKLDIELKSEKLKNLYKNVVTEFDGVHSAVGVCDDYSVCVKWQ